MPEWLPGRSHELTPKRIFNQTTGPPSTNTQAGRPGPSAEIRLIPIHTVCEHISSFHREPVELCIKCTRGKTSQNEIFTNVSWLHFL